jgi:Spy/CpxP family protein refolding chaperone
MKSLLSLLSLFVAITFVTPLYAQDTAAQADMQILIDKVKADKKLLVAQNMNLTDAESQAFWPIYDSYQKDLGAINQRTLKLIKSYADAWNSQTLDDTVAKKLLNEMVAIQGSEANLTKTYAAKLSAALPAMKAARYLQIENKIRAVVRYQLAANIPLVP